MIIENGKKLRVGFTCSSFDLCHAGHVTMLEEAKHQCDYLILGLQTDPTIDRPTKNKPIQSIVERFVQLDAIKYVNKIIPYATEKDLCDILLMCPIDIRILGDEYKDKDFTGKDICVKRGIELYFNRRDHSFSSTDLRKRIHCAEYEKNNKEMKLCDKSISSSNDVSFDEFFVKFISVVKNMATEIKSINGNVLLINEDNESFDNMFDKFISAVKNMKSVIDEKNNVNK